MPGLKIQISKLVGKRHQLHGGPGVELLLQVIEPFVYIEQAVLAQKLGFYFRQAIGGRGEGEDVVAAQIFLEKQTGQGVEFAVRSQGQQAANARQRAAEDIVHNDPYVQQLVRDFGAKIVPGSIKPA